jgi:stage II sporulation protein P
MRRYYHRTIVIRDIFSNYFIYTGVLILVMSAILTVFVRFNIKPDDGYVLRSFKQIMAIEKAYTFKSKNIYDMFSEIVPLVKSSDEMMKKYQALYGGVKRKDKPQKTGFLEGKQVEEIDMSSGGLKFNNATTYPLNADALRNAKLEFSNPAVLIVHTHTSEAYAEQEGARSREDSVNMVRIGTIVKENLERQGIKVIHDTTHNDYPAYNGSYNKALGVIQRNLSENPDIQVVLDIHRDYTARTANETEIQLKPVTSVNGSKTSQVMFVVGTGHSGLNHPNWRHNLAFAVKLNDAFNEIAPNVMRPINVRKERFNQHQTLGSLIVEVGAASNSLYESENAAYYIAQAVAMVLKNY